MSDEHESRMMQLAVHIAAIYKGIVHACGSLPLPIALPSGIVTPEEFVPAVRRVASIAEEIPGLPEEQQANLFATCVFWLGAMDLYTMENHSSELMRDHCVAANCISAEESLLELLYWLRREDEQADRKE